MDDTLWEVWGKAIPGREIVLPSPSHNVAPKEHQVPLITEPGI